jgi:transposase
MSRFDLSDAGWAIIAPLLPRADGRRRPGRPTRDDRRVLNGIFFVLRTGIPWRDLPERYGPYTTAYNRFNRWARAGIRERLFEALGPGAHRRNAEARLAAVSDGRGSASVQAGSARTTSARTMWPVRSSLTSAGAS